MAHGFNSILNALQMRFDYYSARVQAREALARVGLDERDAYADHDVQRIVDALAAANKGLDKVWSKLGVAPSGQPLPAPVAVTPPPAPPAPEPILEAAPEPITDSAPEPTVDVAPEAEAAPEASFGGWDDVSHGTETAEGETSEGESSEGDGERQQHGHGRNKKDKKQKR